MSINDKLLKSAAAGGLTPSENFKVVTYTGNGGTQAITGVGFKPDVVWAKKRSGSDDNVWFDTTRGVQKELISNSNAAEATKTAAISSFDSDGFTTGNNGALNSNGDTYVAWCWKANGGTTSSNTDGSQTTTVQANTAAGVSIITGTMGSSGSSTFGHGLGVAPKMIIHKDSANANAWMVYHESMGAGKEIRLNETNAATSSTTPWGNTAPTTTVYTGGNGYIANAGANFVAYCFAEVDGFSKFGSYTGDRTNDVIVETGFEVGWVMIKAADATDDWFIISQETGNTQLYANKTDAEASFTGVSFLSNGFMLNGSANSGGTNNAGTTFIYMAFATDPDTEAPTLADSFGIKTYTGDYASTNAQTGLGFSPNLVIIKNRPQADSWRIFDTIRGATNYLASDGTGAEATNANTLKSFDADGFTVGSDGTVNATVAYVAYAWKANDDVPTILPNSELSSLISKYKFEDNANDDYGDNNGTASNLSYVTGRFNEAADFNGSSSKILYPQAAPFNDSNTILAISAWVKLDSASDEFVIMSASSTSDNADYMMLVVGGSQAGRVFMTDAPSNANEYQASFGSTNDTNWNHYVWQLSASGGIELWFNGTKQTRTQTYQAGSLNETKWFGDLTYATSVQYGTGINRVVTTGYSNGAIDQMRLFNAELTSSEISSLYNEANEALVSVNANAGFSIVKATFAGEGVIPHGLSSTPEMVILKGVSAAEDWQVYHTSLGTGKYLKLNTGDAVATRANSFSSVNATSVTNNWTGGSVEWIMYCFHSVTGYSKFGTYTGNGGTQAITGLGFQPDYVLCKSTSASSDWNVTDSARGVSQGLNPNTSAVEGNQSPNGVTVFGTDGFTVVDNSGGGAGVNGSSITYIYMAFKIN